MAYNAKNTGIYHWVNNKTNSAYVGSAINLSNKLIRYYLINQLTKKNIRPIELALIKYGHRNFSLEIIEYCPKDKLLERENF